MTGGTAKTVGLLCNCEANADPHEVLSPSVINRAVLIDELLAPDDIGLFLYSPRDVVPGAEVDGYRVDGHRLVPDRGPVPKVNANWTYGTRRLINRGMGYREFKQWTEANGVEVFVPYAFSELVSNKRKAYDVIRGFDESLHPHTEDFAASVVQMETLLERSPLLFVKPRAGNRGNRIFVVRRTGDAISLKYYDAAESRLFSPITLDSAVGVIDVAAGRKRYVIQEGIESLRFDGSVFDVRVVMVNDSRAWHSILETRLAPPDSDLSNIFQGGTIRETEELLPAVLGEDPARQLEKEIRAISHGLAEHLGSLYPDALMEIGFDFVIDADRKPRLVEVNAKPGVAGFGSEVPVYDWKPEDEAFYTKWVRPHVRYLADFLRARVAG